MANSIAYRKNYTDRLNRVHQKAACSTVPNSPRSMARAGCNAKEIMIPKTSVTGLGDYTRNVGYKMGSITFDYETKAFGYDLGIRLFADVVDIEEAGVMDCFVRAGAELRRTYVAPEANAFTYATIASHKGVTVEAADLSSAKTTDGRAIDFIVLEKSAVIEFDKHAASRVFSPDELESLDSYMMKYCQYGIVELLDNRLQVCT